MSSAQTARPPHRVVTLEARPAPIGDGLARSNHEASLLAAETIFGWVSSSTEFALALG